MRLLVRHAHAGHKRHWSGPDAERPLSTRGWGQAEGLLDTLADLRVERLLTSPSLRCRQTLLPVAAALDLELEPVGDLGIDGDVDRLVELLAAGDSDGAVLCTHGEVLGELFARLRASGDIAAEGRLRCEKGSTWVLEGAADGRLHAHYLPPPAPGTKHRWWWQGSVRAELGRLALEQQRLLGTIAALTRTTQQLAATLGQQLAALSAERAALSPLDQVRETARALGDTHTRLVETRRVLIDSLGDLVFAAGDETRYREYLYSLMQRCSRVGVSLLLTLELPDLFQITRLSELGISHVSDNVVLLQYLRQPAVIRRTLTVIKTRASLHQPQVREFTITSRGITLEDQIPAAPASPARPQPTEATAPGRPPS